MDENEQFVRSAWEQDARIPCDQNVSIVLADPYWQRAFGDETDKRHWQLAADFTRQRLEEVHQLQREIDLLNLLTGHDELDSEDVSQLMRTIVRLQAILAEKKQGMKEGSWN